MDMFSSSTTSSIQPSYWDEACEHLMKRDRILRKLIPAHANQSIRRAPAPFVTLARIIIYQQISLAQGRILWARLVESCGGAPTAQCLLAYDEAALRELGLSKRKAQYILELARHCVDSGIGASRWSTMDDAAIVAELCTIRGVGRWTAEMFLIFNLRRPDVLPLDDTALLRAISHHYFSGEPVSRFEAREVAQAWAPWRTVASWYLWRSTEAAAVEY
ncbi:MAG: DNA-3-methyladenine glycosylase 2 family protein [Alcaligenaceae bacterium]|nr:DNA-3-methyladenine glycosylase 2 family protein [Alcaligenaceae bacterium]